MNTLTRHPRVNLPNTLSEHIVKLSMVLIRYTQSTLSPITQCKSPPTHICPPSPSPRLLLMKANLTTRIINVMPRSREHELTGSHNTFASGGSDGFISLWDHLTKKRMKQYPKYPISISALSFSPDGTKLAIGASNEYDNSTPPVGPETMQVLLMVKDTVMEDSKVRLRLGV